MSRWGGDLGDIERRDIERRDIDAVDFAGWWRVRGPFSHAVVGMPFARFLVGAVVEIAWDREFTRLAVRCAADLVNGFADFFEGCHG